MKYVVETRFNVNDDVWVMYDNRPRKFKISEIIISEYIIQKRHEDVVNNNSCKYRLSSASDIGVFYDHQIYSTKKELIEALMKMGDEE